MKTPTCYGQTRTRTSVQEWYCTQSRDAGRRAKALRAAGFRVSVEGMGGQVTNVGRVAMTLLTVHYPDGRELPPRVEAGV